jgi:hypothetical protein
MALREGIVTALAEMRSGSRRNAPSMGTPATGGRQVRRNLLPAMD